jgi:hypothetical protein
MTALAVVVQQLDALADEVADRRDDSVEQYLFGARTVRVHVPRGASHHQPRGGLVTADDSASAGHTGSDPVVDLFLLTTIDVARLKFPLTRIGAPYGAVLESLDTDWLITWDSDTASLLALHRESRVALWHPGVIPPPRERAEFCRPLLHWLAVLDGHVVIHAGAVSVDGHGILVAGAGNAGKSTLVRACWEAGWAVLGDNVVELVPAGDGNRVVPVYPTFKIRPGSVLPIPTAWPAPEWDHEAEKHIYFLADALAPGFAHSVDHVITLVLDEHRGEGVGSISRAEAFFRVAPNTVAQFPFFEQEVLTRAGSVIAAAPTWAAGRIPVDSIAAEMAALLETAVHRGVLR